MNLLAIECSSAQGSLALLADGRLLAEEVWMEARFRNQHLFAVLPGLLERVSLRLEEIGLFAAGRGPGNYSGMRVALAAAQALARPGRRPVFAVSSGEALAVETSREAPGAFVAVAGDARRGQVWRGVFAPERGSVRAVGGWSLLRLDELGNDLPAGTVLVSPDGDRLRAALPAADRGGPVRWLPGNRYPGASAVGRLAHRLWREGGPSEPLVPLYMHPPV